MRKRQYSIGILIAITLIGGAIRIIGIKWGLPNKLHPDESSVVYWAVEMIGRRSFEPGKFNRPDHFEIMLNSILFNIYSLFKYQKTADVIYENNIVPFYLIARYLTALWGTAMIPLGYLVLEKVKKNSGLIGAATIAFFPSFVLNSRYATPDIPLSFVVLLFIYTSLHYMDYPSIKNLFILCLLTAVGITIKYPAAILCVMIAFLVIVQSIRNRDFIHIVRQGTMSIFFVLGCTFLISPVLFTNLGRVIQVLHSEARTEHLGADGLGYWGNLIYYSKLFFNQIGIVYIIFILLGVVILIRKRNKSGIALLTGLVYWILMSNVALHWERWAVPMFLSPLLFGSIGLSELTDPILPVIKKLMNKRWAATTISLLVLALALNMLVGSLAIVTRFIVPDTRIVALEYCLNNGITQENTLYEGWTPFKLSTSTKIFDSLSWQDDQLTIKSNGKSFNYIILSSGMYGRYMNEPERYSKEVGIYKQIDKQYQLIKEFPYQPQKNSLFCISNIINNLKYSLRAVQQGYAGYEIKIYRIN